MRPVLPDADALLPYLRQIDNNGHYTNFGPLQNQLLAKLLNIQSVLESQPIYGALTSSATQGLELVISCLNLPPSSQILVPALTFVATATAVQRCGHIPVVGDVDPDNWMLTPASIAQHPSLQEIKAVIPVATFGMPQNADAWSNWGQLHNIPVIIDAASSFGAQRSAPGVSVVFSLHATKVLSTGEGGLIVTRSFQLAEQFKNLTNFGIGMTEPGIGTNAKLSEYHAAIGLAHLEIWPVQIKKRKQLLTLYKEALGQHLSDSLSLQEDTGLFAPSVFNIQFTTAALRSQLEATFASVGIQTRRWYQPLLQHQPLLSNVIQPAPCPNAESLSQTLLGLPFFIGLTTKQIKQVCEVIKPS
jgi:dTDP-4-amino-4,6-dideoxygalactose transaminase